MAGVLIVDDEPSIRETYGEFAVQAGHDVQLAEDGAAAMEILRRRWPLAVVVSDLRMPRVDGIRLLEMVRSENPDAVRILLTAFADVETAIDAVNRGNIFRLLTKPCPRDAFLAALEAAMRQYELIAAERELLEKTLKGSVELLSELLSLSDPDAVDRAGRLRHAARDLASALGEKRTWQVEMAAMLGGIGYVTMPSEVRAKVAAGKPMSLAERQLADRAPEIGHRLLSKIPRLHEVARIVLYRQKRFDGTGVPPDDVQGEKLPLGSRILRPLLELSARLSEGSTLEAALIEMRLDKGAYDPAVLDTIARRGFAWNLGARKTAVAEAQSLPTRNLSVGDVLAADLYTQDGKRLLAAGNMLTEPLLERLWNYSRLFGLREPVLVFRTGAAERGV